MQEKKTLTGFMDLETGATMTMDGKLEGAAEMNQADLAGLASLYAGELKDRAEFVTKNSILENRYPSASQDDFYRELFPAGSLSAPGPEPDGKGNAIITAKAGDTMRTYVVLDDLSYIPKASESVFAILPPCSFFGRRADGLHIHELFAFAIDVDFVHPKNLEALLFQIERNIIPTPTYIVNSGHGIHLYYILDNPLPVFTNIKSRLNAFKGALTRLVANPYTSAFLEDSGKDGPDELWIGQGMRLVGGYAKYASWGDKYRLSAFRCGDKVSLNYLNQYVPDDFRLDDLIFEPESTVPLDEAKELWPEWYERVIVGGERSARWKWHVKRDLYDWWKKKISVGAIVGTRYFCLMCLSIFAIKCDIAKEELEADALELRERFDSLDPAQPFTFEDMEAALHAYLPRYNTFPREDIAKLCRFNDMGPVKRNKQPQAWHLEEARAVRDIRQKRKGTNWWDNGNRSGAPTKENLVKEYAAAHPEANHSEIARALGISRPTVIKWLQAKQQN